MVAIALHNLQVALNPLGNNYLHWTISTPIFISHQLSNPTKFTKTATYPLSIKTSSPHLKTQIKSNHHNIQKQIIAENYTHSIIDKWKKKNSINKHWKLSTDHYHINVIEKGENYKIRLICLNWKRQLLFNSNNNPEKIAN